MPSTRIPYTHVFPLNPLSVAVLANGHFSVIESLTGRIVRSTPELANVRDRIAESGQVVCATISEGGRYLVTVTGDKIIRVWEVSEENLILSSERENPKKATDVKFAGPDGCSSILVSDKFGDIHFYPLHRHHALDSEQQVNKSVVKRGGKKVSDGKLLLGHVSHLSSFLLSFDEKYIITADRDEHIRVSWYPESHIIETFCLGQKKFVSALHIPRWAPEILVSGGGDPVIKFWDWFRGKLLKEVLVDHAVKPFIKVTREREGKGGESDGEDGGSRLFSSRKRRKEDKKRRKGEATETIVSETSVLEDGDGPNDSESMDIDKPENEATEKNHDNASGKRSEEPVLAVRRISSFASQDNRLVLFCATGATALFYCDYPDVSDNTIRPHVLSFDFKRPVLDFVCDEKENRILVLLDGNWSEGEGESTAMQMASVVSFSNGKLVLSEGGSWQKMIETLNSYQYPAEDHSYDDLYSALTILPKHVEENSEENQGKASSVSQKELGRQKSKVARSRVISSMTS